MGWEWFLGRLATTARTNRTVERRTKEQTMTESTAAVVDANDTRGVDLYFDPATLRPQSPSNQA
jgi:hypothetical protein